jgi:hypothetical protein
MTTAEEFEAAKVEADGRRQQKHREVREDFSAARETFLADWRQRKSAAEQRFEAVKSDPHHPKHDATRAELDALQVQPDDRHLRTELDREIRAADVAYHAEVRAAAQRLGVSIG